MLQKVAFWVHISLSTLSVVRKRSPLVFLPNWHQETLSNISTNNRFTPCREYFIDPPGEIHVFWNNITFKWKEKCSVVGLVLECLC